VITSEQTREATCSTCTSRASCLAAKPAVVSLAGVQIGPVSIVFSICHRVVGSSVTSEQAGKAACCTCTSRASCFASESAVVSFTSVQIGPVSIILRVCHRVVGSSVTSEQAGKASGTTCSTTCLSAESTVVTGFHAKVGRSDRAASLVKC
jgi:hypothetical protein